MKVLYVTGQLGDADFIDHELRKKIPDLQLDVSPKVEDALTRLADPDQYDAVLLDPTLSDGKALDLINPIREKRRALAIVEILSANDEAPPLKELEAGLDDYIVKRANFVNRLADILMRAVQRHRSEDERLSHPIRVLFAGDITLANQHFGSLPLIYLESAICGPDGTCQGPETVSSEKFPYDVVVIDDAVPGAHVLQLFKDVTFRAPDVPVVLLVEPDHEEVALQALKLGAAECVVKTGEYFQRLFAILENVIRRRNLLREKTILLSTEARLRTLIETVPACVTVLSGDGTFLAINLAGLPLMGAKRVEQIVGKNLFAFAAAEHQDQLWAFFDRICEGDRDSMQFDCEGLD